MKQQFYAGMPWVDFALFGFAVFVAIFAIALWRIVRQPQPITDSLARLPLQSEDSQ